MLAHDFVIRADKRRLTAQQGLDPATQLRLGQHFTPHLAAKLIASIPRLPISGSLKILDPGAGTGSLLTALYARIIEEAPSLDVHITALELDSEVAEKLRETMEDLQTVAASAGIKLTTEVIESDFIAIESAADTDYDLVIMNPPYQKLPAKSDYRTVMTKLGVHTPNIYAAFVARGIMQLKKGGQLVAITPRSFTNGVYFEQFRSYILAHTSLDHIHVFDSRSTVFADTGVLQENIIFSVTKNGTNDSVTLSASIGHEHEIRTFEVPSFDIVRPTDRRQFIRIPVGQGDDETVTRMLDLPTSLDDLGICVSTGRVVDFRSRENLSPGATTGFPMVYPANLSNGRVEHPKVTGKPQWFNATTDNDRNLLVPSGHYVLVKRFSAKEERRRIVAGVWSPDSNDIGPVAFDNKLNYFHANGVGLDRKLAVGLTLWLNSSFVDKYFRTFSGHTQVNATDLREMRYPNTDELLQMGEDWEVGLPTQDVLDELVRINMGWKEDK
ncbi:Eco57I restriction-modification methylase domain-containing protein [Arthrobacter zhaoxinii]|uniref:site-specific DNA-methyltransferase (adenine-specific) n=1 Tax=Arthrobacter zhaoxinii TaxID=2964616 RepID=A0ABY5YRM6_9MICC|nr:Eco57I restriction-modification methylase domain-containing protein [Arthrobacter zhaoxinii]UWX97752.1 Eco57I restriction-modification methylase domain-containing protein [Arthrobacter zhaoxinii]